MPSASLRKTRQQRPPPSVLQNLVSESVLRSFFIISFGGMCVCVVVEMGSHGDETAHQSLEK